MVKASAEIKKYFKTINEGVKRSYDLATIAHKKGLDPDEDVSIPLAKNMAERVVGLISVIAPQIIDSKVTERILELEKEYGLLDWRVGFKIAEEVAKEKVCKFEDKKEAMEVGIRVGFAYLTLGIVSAPLEGFIGLKIKKRRDGKEYFALQYAGPIRAAGGTASSVSVLLGDYVRVKMGYAAYDPDENEVKRYVTENLDYHERVTNLQYLPTEEEMVFLAKNLPIQMAGEPTEKREVSNFKNLERVETNFIRGGMCLAFSEGLAQKAAKGFRLLEGVKEKGFKITGFDFVAEYIELHKKRDTGKTDSSPTYIKDLVAGRPVLAYPLDLKLRAPLR